MIGSRFTSFGDFDMLKLEIKLIVLYFTTLASVLTWSIFEISIIILPLLIAVSLFMALIVPPKSKLITQIFIFMLFMLDLALLTHKAGSLGIAVGALNLLPMTLALKSHKNLRASAIR